MNINKKFLLVAFALCGMLLLNVRTMFAPDLLKEPMTGGQDPMEVARANHSKQALLSARRSLTAVLSTDAEGKHSGVDFTQNDKRIFLVWQDRTGSKGDRIRVSWVAEAVDGIPKDRPLSEESETLPGAGPFKSSFFLSPAKATLPLGTYRADLYKNTTLVRVLRFAVKR